MQTVPAEVDENGNVTLLVKLPLASRRRALLTVFEDGEVVSESALLSEAALAEDWDRPEEDQAWSNLRLAP